MTSYVCVACGLDHDRPIAPCSCGGALDHIGGPDQAKAFGSPGEARGVWRYRTMFDVADEAVTTLGEGATPLVHDDEIGASFKLEYANPTGSFKDRGASVVASVAGSQGATHLVEDSSGNAGTATAAYAARAGMTCSIFAPEQLTSAKRAQMETLGADVHVVGGPRQGVTDAAISFARENDAFYASHAYLPEFLDGCSTIAFELVREDGSVPDVLVTPCAMGSVLLGCARAFEALYAAGVLERTPRLIAVQAAGHDPIARAFGHGSDEANTMTDGLLIQDPPRRDAIITAVKASAGTSVAVTEQQTLAALARLHRRGLLVEPSSAAGLAGLDLVRASGRVRSDDDVVVVLTGRFKPGA